MSSVQKVSRYCLKHKPYKQVFSLDKIYFTIKSNYYIIIFPHSTTIVQIYLLQPEINLSIPSTQKDIACENSH